MEAFVLLQEMTPHEQALEYTRVPNGRGT
jgi:hypothetical protein